MEVVECGNNKYAVIFGEVTSVMKGQFLRVDNQDVRIGDKVVTPFLSTRMFGLLEPHINSGNVHRLFLYKAGPLADWAIAGFGTYNSGYYFDDPDINPNSPPSASKNTFSIVGLIVLVAIGVLAYLSMGGGINGLIGAAVVPFIYFLGWSVLRKIQCRFFPSRSQELIEIHQNVLPVLMKA